MNLFSELILDIADEEIVDEVLILLTDIWVQFLEYR